MASGASSSSLSDTELDETRLPPSRMKRYSQLNEECEDLEQLLEWANQTLAKKRIKRSHFAPAYSLPDELWCHIFTDAYAHDSPHCHTSDSAYDMESSLMPLTCVSRYFRRLSLSLPSLWTCIHVTPSWDVRRQCYSHRLTQLRLQLARSHSLPLSILFSCHPSGNHMWSPNPNTALKIQTWAKFRESEHYAHFIECWKLLLGHTARWQHLTILVEYADMFTEVWRRMLTDNDKQLPDLPLLRHLDVYAEVSQPSIWAHAAASVDARSLSASATMLKCLRLHGVGLASNSNMFLSGELPDLPLAELALVTSGANLLPLATLSLRGSLTTLALRDVHTVGLPAADSSMSEFPNLTTLYLVNIDPTQPDANQRCGSILAFLLKRAPRLERLEVGGMGDASHIFAGSIASHTFPSVHTIILRTFDYSPPSGRFPSDCPFLDPFTELRHLHILEDNCAPYIETLLERSQSAFVGAQPRCLWPHLENLTVADVSEHIPDTDFSVHLHAFARFRREVGHTLRAVDLIPDWVRRPVLDEAAQRLKQSDVIVGIWHQPPSFVVGDLRWQRITEQFLQPEWTMDITQRYELFR